MRGEVAVPGKDLCDMSGAKGRTPEQFTVYNIMLPRIYYPDWQGNILEKRCKVNAHAPELTHQLVIAQDSHGAVFQEASSSKQRMPLSIPLYADTGISVTAVHTSHATVHGSSSRAHCCYCCGTGLHQAA